MKNLTQLTTQKTLLATSIASIFLGLTACGGGGGGGDAGTTSNVQMSGAVVDDFVAYAKVYIDVNKNGKYDSEFEPSAYTDKDGYFSTAKDGTNYCADTKSTNFRYCLQGDAALKNGGVLRVESGRDLLTSQVYNASMSLLLNANTSGLKVTSISTLNQELDNLSDADIPGGLTKEQFKTQFSTFLGNFLGTQTKATSATVDPNIIDPFAANVANKARAFKMSIQFHKLAEGIAQAFVNANTGTKLTDFLPATYRALLLNADFSNGASTDPLSAFSGKADAVLSKVASITGKTKPTKATEMGNLNSYLNCILGVSTDTYTDKPGTCTTNLTDTTSLADKKKSLFASEVAKVVALDTNATDRLNNAIKIKDSTTFDYTKQDYVTTVKSATNTASTSFSATVGGAQDFPDMAGKDVTITGTTNAFRIYFKTDGNVIACQKEGTSYNLVQGTYSQDATRKFLAYLSVLGSTYSITNLDPAAVGATVPECNGKLSCIAASYKTTETNEYKNEYFGNSSSTTAQLFKDTTSVPTSTSQCQAAFN